MKALHATLLPFIRGVVLLVGVGLSLQAELIDQWTYRNPIPSNADMYNGAYGNGTYVIISRGVGLHTTPDGVTWSTDYRDEYLENVIFAEGQFTISGSSGQILRSDNGLDWTTYPSGADVPLYGLAYGEGRYVAVGEQGVTVTSVNGMDWTTGSTGDGDIYWSAAFGEGRFVAVSGSGTIVSSTDGSTWVPGTLDASVPGYTELYAVGYGAGWFIAGGYFWDEFSGIEGSVLLSSDDGVTWSLVVDPDIPSDATRPGGNTQYWVDEVKYNGSQFVAAGESGLLLVSNDGLDWSYREAGTTADFYGLAFGATETLAFGRRGIYAVSSDLNTWSPSFPSPALGFGRWETLNYNGTQYVIAGDLGLLATSEDGLQWESRAKPVGTAEFSDSAYGNGRWVVSSQAKNDNLPLITSADGIVWELANLPAGFNKCSGVAFGSGVFVAAVSEGPSRFLRSENGVDWTAVDVPQAAVPRGVEFGGGQFVAWTSPVAGPPSSPVRIAVSADGLNWEIHDTPVTTWAIQEAAFGNGRWNFVGSSGGVLSTTDHSAWAERQLTYQGRDPVILHGVTFGNDHWVIAGRQHSIWSSADGINWEEAFTTGMSITGSDVYWDVMFDGNSFWACGQNGDLVQSESVTGGSGRGPAQLAMRHSATPGSVTLVVQGRAGDDWDVIFSPTLSPVAGETRDTIVLGDAPTEWTEPIEGSARGFYWLKAPGSTP